MSMQMRAEDKDRVLRVDPEMIITGIRKNSAAYETDYVICVSELIPDGEVMVSLEHESVQPLQSAECGPKSVCMSDVGCVKPVEFLGDAAKLTFTPGNGGVRPSVIRDALVGSISINGERFAVSYR